VSSTVNAPLDLDLPGTVGALTAAADAQREHLANVSMRPHRRCAV